MSELAAVLGDAAPVWLVAIWSLPAWLRAVVRVLSEIDRYRACRRRHFS
jgi:hypothetical protein